QASGGGGGLGAGDAGGGGGNVGARFVSRTVESGGTETVIRNVPVRFPFKPYDLQCEYMDKVLAALEQEEQYALLESPTGTGKTLSLLCALLGWQAQHANRLAELKSKHAAEGGAGTGAMEKQTPTIIYASRTHSQLSQVVNELKQTSYRPHLALLSSRENLCVHPEVRKDKGINIRNACRNLVKQKECRFYENLRRVWENMSLGGGMQLREESEGFLQDGKAGDATELRRRMIMDVEELATMAARNSFCPYHLSRDKQYQNQVDLVLMPYNYLIDPSVRKGLEVRWDNAVVVIDEAHNLEKICDEAFSFSFSADTLAKVSQEVLGIKDHEFKGAGGGPNSGLTESNFAQLATVLRNLIRKIDGMQLHRLSAMGNATGRVLSGAAVIDLLEEVEIVGPQRDRTKAGKETVSLIVEMIDKMLTLRPESNNLEKFKSALECLFEQQGNKTAREHAHDYYRGFVCRIAPPNFADRQGGHQWGRQQQQQQAANVLHVWCFSPGVALSSLKRMGVYSIILTSGTLSPLRSFASQLRLPFPIRLENPHVVDDSQIWIGVVPKGVMGKSLNSSYRNRENKAYLDDLGNTIANYARIVPDGVLVFFPSYYVMNKSIESWQASGIYERINSKKKIVVEAKTAAEMTGCVKRYEQLILSGRGALFFAVCRGKASEGIDFADKKARAVIITGLPFPPKNDPQIVLKREYLDKLPVDPTKRFERLTGQEWYSQQAYRAVNQAIGRVIRHRFDYGAVILCDDRFASPSAKNSLSLWLRSRVHVCKSYGESNMQLVRFFKQNVARPELNQRSKKQTSDKRIRAGASHHRIGTKVQAGSSISSKRVESITSLTQGNTAELSFDYDGLGNPSAPSSSSSYVETQRQKLLEQEEQKRLKKRVADAFDRALSKKEAEQFMQFTKRSLDKADYALFKSLLVDVRKALKSGLEPAQVKSRAEAIFSRTYELFMRAKAYAIESLLTEFVFYLPKEVREVYKATVLSKL
ncbi:Regulator of telomere elongation helicase 1 homolog, partial [Durusdinium trenchii]